PYPPTDLEATPSITTSQLTWTAGAAEIGWQVRKGETGAVVDVSTIGYQANALSPGTQYTYYIRSNYGDNLYSIWVPISFRTLAIPQRVTTLASTEIGQTTANVHGTVIAGTDTIINQGFQYRVLGGDTNWTSVSATFDDTIAYNLTGLLPYAVYEFRAFASTAYVTINGRTQSFTTLPAPPSAITSPATLIEQTVATLNGIVTQGTRPLTTKGFEWRLVGATTWTTVTSTLTDDATTYNLTGLIPITNYEYRVFATTASEIVYGSIANFTTLAIVPPTVTTIPATSIAQTIATLNANIVLGSEIITEQGFEWRLSGASTWTTLTSTLNAGIITNNLTGLVASTDYEYRAYATTASGSVYGEIQNFTTLAIVPPTVITGEAIAVAQTIETINGTITAGSELVTNQGFEWRLLGESVWTPLTVSLVDNAMTYNLTALTANTNYEFRAFATTESTTTYGNIVAFRTLAMDPPVVITTAATLISQTSVTLNGSAMVVMAPITSQGFEWRLSGETTWTIIPTAIIDNNLIHNLTGLTAYTDYEFRAFATTSEGTTYGLTQSFKTLPIAPTVVTNPATSITQIIATLNGAVADGSETISAKGFEWRKVGATSWTNIILPENTLVYNLTGIVANTNYEFRAYATTESGSVYGITQTFTTLAIVPPTVVTNVATLVDQTTATINGAITAGSESILSQGFEWKLASASAWTQITSIPTSTITHNLTGLTPDRAYEFRAYATTESGTTYGTIQSFSTLVIPQAVVTNPANSITETNATLNAVVTSGSELLTSHGFEWKVSNSSTWTIVTSPLIGNALTYSLIGLTPNMDYEFRAYATTASGTIYGQIQNFTTLAIPTIVVTSSATSVAQTIATINGTITLGSKPLTSQGFEWKLASASTWTVVAKSLIGNTITHNLTGLTANTAYEFRAYAINASETIYGEVQSFTTLATVPTVVTNAATLVAQTTATLNGAITIGSESIIAQGFEWKLSSATAWIAQTSTLNGNAITHNLTGLNPNSAYQYRAYATTLSGTVYGTTQNFTTLAIVPPTVVTNAATLISQNTATLNGTVTIGSDEILVQGFEWKLATSSTWLPLTSTLTGNAITHNLIGLTPNTAYQFRAYVTTSAGTVSGTTQSFTTLAIVPPTVVTSVATAISQNIATLNGTITAGSELISSQGFEYKLTSSSTWIPIAANLNGNAITYNLLGLTPNSAYQFRAYATTFNGTVYGSTQTFTTLAIVPPTIVTSAATLIAQTSATLNGTITSGSEAIITQGFEWTLSSSNAWTITTEPLTGNAMTNILTGLNPNTSYKYRAYVITLSGTVYGQTQTFTTLSITPPTVLTSAATAITTNSATLNGTITAGTEAVISQGFEWRVFNTNIWMPITTTGSALTHNLLGLTPNESYEFRVYATTASGNVYGEIQDFTTLAIIPPTVVTNPPIVTSSREVTLSGTVISGSESILAQGFEWKEAGASQWTVVAGTLTGNTITYNLTGLTPNQSYRFRAGVVTESGITYGETQIFTTLGLNGAEGNEISIKMYPNPAKIQTKLIVSGISGDVKIILSDVQGRILSTVNTEAVSGVLEHTLDLNDLVEGVYYIRIQNSVINKTQKLIVK
ncbi:MAG: T9SS type A sorting domain-containing protein, partial [Bacteroidales bacterium]